MGLKILLAEDEVQLSKVYAMALTHQGHEVDQAFNGQEAVDKALNNQYDVLLCDVMMPVKNGLEAVKSIRDTGSTLHIIMLTALAELEDKITGLENGADDYLTKPISLKELLARMASLERRLSKSDKMVYSLNNTTLNITQLELVAENTIRLSIKEGIMLAHFMSNSDQALSTNQIFQTVWGKDDDPDLDEGYVYIYVSYLRQKLKSIGSTLVIDGQENGEYTLITSAQEA